MKSTTTTKHGFTIVELLIVIVVIAILAAISIVAYVGISAQAEVSRKKSEVKQIQKSIEVASVDNPEITNTEYGHYPYTNYSHSTGAVTAHGMSGVQLSDSVSGNIVYCQHNEGLLCSDDMSVTPKTYIISMGGSSTGYGTETYSISYWNDTEKLWSQEWVGVGLTPDGSTYVTPEYLYEWSDETSSQSPCSDITFERCSGYYNW